MIVMVVRELFLGAIVLGTVCAVMPAARADDASAAAALARANDVLSDRDVVNARASHALRQRGLMRDMKAKADNDADAAGDNPVFYGGPTPEPGSGANSAAPGKTSPRITGGKKREPAPADDTAKDGGKKEKAPSINRTARSDMLYGIEKPKRLFNNVNP